MRVTALSRAADASAIHLRNNSNLYKAQKVWPPDFSKLDAKHQFRLERRYRRRANLKWSRPGWIKGVKLAQWVICSGTITYWTRLALKSC